MRLIGIVPPTPAGIMLVQIYSSQNRANVRIRTNPICNQHESEQILILGSTAEDDTFHVLAEVSSNPSKSLCDSSGKSSLNINPYQLIRKAA